MYAASIKLSGGSMATLIVAEEFVSTYKPMRDLLKAIEAVNASRVAGTARYEFDKKEIPRVKAAFAQFRQGSPKYPQPVRLKLL